ncbi:hypothetical protein JG687_00009898 [Phytophthora cactorum]|uniref:AAA+ ATPase domain-containing protein n=1 Tax=Phytophthora cactorum TaxID=29920 RepID=A0A8T1UCM9_9STRA|nr:hypothetical protein JG687_00009898 [Phytophthora cactorum]
MKRQTILTKRNHAFLIGRTMIVIIMGFIFASLFDQLDMVDTQVRIIFASMLFLGLGQAAMLSMFYDSLNIPLTLLESLVFGSLVYSAGGFANEVGVCLLFELFLMLVILVFLALFFFLVPATPNLSIAKPAAVRKVDPVSVAFKGLWYTVQAPVAPGQSVQSLDLLKGITGYVLPGKIMALMVSTGAGKTTLKDVMAGRKGDDVPDGRKFDSVDECLELLGLEEIADQMIRGSSMEKMKRTTIGVEMAAQPSVLFLNEPTSGLDARSAKVIMEGVRKVADSGRTVLCTIHQPSTDAFRLFDSLLLLKREGETVYFGDLGHDFIGAGVASQCQAGQEHQAVNFVKYFNASVNKKLLDMMSEAEQFKSVSYSKKRAASSTTQLRFLLDRFFTLYWRTPLYNLTRFVTSVFLSPVFGLVYVSAGSKTFTIVELPYAFVGAFLFTIIYYPIVGLEGFADGAYMGQLLVFVVPSIEVAAVIGILFNAVCLLAP